MLSSKLKSWVESHLTRKKSSAAGNSSSGKKSNGSSNSGGNHHHHHSIGKESPADRIAHPASSLVNLVPAVPLCSSSGRSNAGLVIRLQNDFAAATSPCHHRSHHPSWTQSPVMLAWNTKVQQPTIPPLSPPPPPPTIQQQLQQQNGEPSPSGSDWTCKSFAGESGIGSRTGNGSLSATGSSMCTADFCEGETGTEGTGGGGGGRMNAPSLSSPESAYSTGCSDGVSPSQEGLFDPSSSSSHHPQQNHLLDPLWRRSLMDAEAAGTSGTNSSSTQSPRTRPAIRTNPWLPVRTSMTSSDRTSWMTDTTPEAALLSDMPAVSVLKETDIVTSSDDDLSGVTNGQLDQLCDSLELLMDGDNLRVMTASTPPQPPPSRWDVDDQYTLLIRQTEEILLQLEKDELLLRNKPEELVTVNNNNSISRPCSVSSAASVSNYRRRLRKTAAMRRCSSRNSAAVFSSSESSDCDEPSVPYRQQQPTRRMLPSVDWNHHQRRPSSRNKGITPRFATRQNVRVLPHPPVTHQQQPSSHPPPPVPPPPPRDCWILGSQRTSCSPDDWTTEHDRPPSPAPMDPHCHVGGWPVHRPTATTRSPSISSYSSSNNNNNNRRSCRQLHSSASVVGSCPTSPAIRDHWDSSSIGGLRASCGSGSSRRWRQSMTREQQRLESQIAFLRRQLKDVTDDYYYDDGGGGHGTPSSDSSDSDSLRLLK